jgi:hypothetical protein
MGKGHYKPSLTPFKPGAARVRQCKSLFYISELMFTRYCLSENLLRPFFNPDSAVEREVMSKEQTFRSEDNAIWDRKCQISNSKIWNLQSGM